MRILLVTESFPPLVSGVSISVSRLAAGMTARGHTVAVLTPDQQGVSESEDLPYTVWRLLSFRNPFRKGLRFSAATRRKIKAQVLEFNPDVIHIHDIASLCRGAAAVGRSEGIPVIATHHFLAEGLLDYVPAGQIVSGAILPALRRSIVILYNRCVHVTVPTQYLKTYLEPWSYLRTKVEVISNGVDTKRFSPGKASKGMKERLGIPENVPVLAYVGRLDPEKNADVLLEVAAKLDPAIPFHLVVIGGGNLVERYKERADELGISQNVTWIKPLRYDDPDLPSMYRLFDIFCMPSPNETESMVTLEAMASGLPVIAADRGALPELVNHENGRLVNSADANAWKRSIEELLAMPAEGRQALGLAGREKVASRSLKHSLATWEKIYKRFALKPQA